MTQEKKVALITGITGQDGAYLAELLLEKAMSSMASSAARRCSTPTASTISTRTRTSQTANFILHYGDMTDSTSLIRIIQQVQPDEIYNLAAQSHVAVSFEEPEYTANADALGTLRILEAIRILGHGEEDPLLPGLDLGAVRPGAGNAAEGNHAVLSAQPYAVAKLYAYWITVNYREAYGMYACNGILFNHESPVRGETFVTRKITRALARIKLGLQDCLYLGNLDALRDWGHARDYVEMQWLMLQQQQPEDFVIATGVQYSVREFVEIAAARNWASPSNGKARASKKKAMTPTGKCIVAGRSALLPPHRSRDPAGRSDQGQASSAGHRRSPSMNWSRKWCAKTSSRRNAMNW